MLKRHLFFFLLITTVFVASAAITTNPNEAQSYTISGKVYYNGSTLSGVEMKGLPGNPITDATGYSVVVYEGWSGVVTPTLYGYSFGPPSINYSPVYSDKSDQDYTAYLANIVAGRNVNMTSSKDWPDPEGDVFLQRQNEPSIAVSTINPLHLLAGCNDYRSVDSWESVGELPGIPEEAAAGDAWLGVFTSYDGGESWKSRLLPGYITDPQPEEGDSLKGYDAASDATVRAGINGLFYYSGIAFSRIRNGPSVIFVARFKDHNITEQDPITGELIYPIRYKDTTIIDEGTSGQFADKPWMAIDIPRNGYPDGIIYLVYSVFLGDLAKNIHNKIMFTRSIDGGESWETPIKLSESHRKNQGTTVAVDPQNGDVYVAWRRFAAGNDPDAIMVTRSTNNGISFNKTIVASIIDFPFDQPTVDTELGTAQFRTYAFPTIAVDNNNTVYLAWAQREYPVGPARIVFKSSIDGLDWSSPTTMVEDYVDLKGHQFMPSMTFAAGKLLIAWFDSRDSVRLKLFGATGKWITDYYIGDCPDPPAPGSDPYPDPGEDHPCHFRETIDVRIAQADPAISQFEPSTFVSRYYWGFKRDQDGNLVKYPPPNDFPIPVQMQYNAPNFPLFKGGEFAFIGDYIDIAPAPMFIENGGSWRFNTGLEPADPFVFYVSWADNRDVSPPLPGNYGENINPWTWYGPPDHINCELGFNPGMRNQNIYVSRITRGVAIGCPENYRPSGEGQQAFVVNVQNMTLYPRTFDLTILNAPDPVSASFVPDDPTISSLSIDVPELSSISRHVFVEASDPHTTVVEVSELGGSVDYVYLHLVAEGGSTGTFDISITEQAPISWSDPPEGIPLPDKNLVNPGFLAPGFLAMDFFNPGFLAPGFLAPGFLAPGFLAPGFLAPGFLAASIYNPGFLATGSSTNIINPGFLAPGFLATPMDEAEIVDKIWFVKNEGTIASSYTLKTIAGDALPIGFYNQLLVYKIHKYPATTGTTCRLYEDARHELLINIVNPDVHPDISSKEKILDPELQNEQFTNATFSLAPGEEAVILLRVVDISGSFPVPFPVGVGGFGGFSVFGDFDGFGGLLGGQDPSTNPEDYADNVGAVVISHSSTEGDITAVTLMILPDSLPPGQAGVSYSSDPLRAIGGTEDYSWDVVSDLLPTGITLNSNGVISGYPKEAGDFTFTVEVTDSLGQTDTQKFTLSIADPTTLTITPPLESAPDGIKLSDYSGNVSFTASGGVLPYSWSLSVTDLASNPVNLGLTPSISGINGEFMDLISAPQLAGDFIITVTVTDDFRPTGQIAEESFDLCVMPLSLIISTDPSPLPDGDLGSSYSAIITVINAEASLLWDVTGLPDGLELSSPFGDSVTITGTPTYDPNVTYPATYDIVVEVTDQFNSACYERGWIQGTFPITVNPKKPIWFAEGTLEGEAIAVAADEEDNVYVTGYIMGNGEDYYTVKYDINGNFVWGKSYNGPGNGTDIPSAIAVDSSGVYVTGTSLGDPTGPDIYTVKYRLSDGEVLWDYRYDGPSHLGDGWNALTLDRDGNPQGAGYVHRGKVTKHADYSISKYSPLGEMIWDERYDSTRNGNDVATAIAVDSSGNVYVTGMSKESLPGGELTTHDFLTIKYSSSGRLQWTVREDGLGFGDDEPTAIALHEVSANKVYIYVTGYATGESSVEKDYYTVAYDANGNKLWPGGKTYNGPGNGDDIATSIDVDSNGNVYVTGKSLGSNGYDYATIKYDSNGNQLWDKRYDGLAGDDEAVSLAVDGEDIYVAGFITTAADKDFFLIKYDTSGNIIWIGQYDGPSGLDDVATAMEVNSGIHVVGFSWKDASTRVYAVVKFEK